MAVSSCARVFPSFECRSDPDFSGIPRPENLSSAKVRGGGTGGSFGTCGLSSLIFRFPPNFVRQLSTKARRNCSNIGVAQVVAASWSNNQAASGFTPVAAAKAVDAASSAAAALTPVDISTCDEEAVVVDNGGSDGNSVQIDDLINEKPYSFLSSDGSVAIHAGERLGRGIVTDAITTPVVNTSAYFFKKTAELIDFKEKRRASFEYGRYGNPTTVVAEEKISALEGAESTLLMASGMCASTVMLLALVPAGGHIVTTTDCYRKTRIFIETVLPKMGIKATVIDPADIRALESALDENKVSLFFTESPTNPFLRCIDIELVSKLCHAKGALVCIDGTFATPLNQKALALGADIVLHSATKYIAGHNDVLAGCISGSEKLISAVRNLHHILGGALNPNAAYLIIRGMKTLHLRVQQQNSTALRMAEILEAHPKEAEKFVEWRILRKIILTSKDIPSYTPVVCQYDRGASIEWKMKFYKTDVIQFQGSLYCRSFRLLLVQLKVKHVYYPGLPSHPEYNIAKQQMTGFGGVVSFEVDGDLLTTAKFVDALKIPYIAPSFGGCESIVDQPAIMSYWDLGQSDRAKYGIMDNLVRFSFGVEEFEDLKIDILKALARI